jgi:hypothetical protein
LWLCRHLWPVGQLRAEMRSGPRVAGMDLSMTDDRTEQRAADLLPEEVAVGSADPEAQAEAILAESDEREADLEAAPDSFLEHRTSAQTMTPGDGTR